MSLDESAIWRAALQEAADHGVGFTPPCARMLQGRIARAVRDVVSDDVVLQREAELGVKAVVRLMVDFAQSRKGFEPILTLGEDSFLGIKICPPWIYPFCNK
ncbi:MAG: hypothetical protein JNL64_11160 [Blastocatellia bacterium]|nr:hypothetical protein [Blastocatellia bacterium]